jgi:hypothetical protein
MRRVAEILAFILLWGLVIATASIAFSQYREMRASGRRIPRATLAVIVLAGFVGLIGGILLAASR